MIVAVMIPRTETNTRSLLVNAAEFSTLLDTSPLVAAAVISNNDAALMTSFGKSESVRRDEADRPSTSRVTLC